MPLMTKNLVTGITNIQVRACIALVFVITLSVGLFLGIVNKDFYENLALVAITYYFTKRQIQDENGTFNKNEQNRNNNTSNNNNSNNINNIKT